MLIENTMDVQVMKNYVSVITVAVAAALPGCASIVDGKNQVVSVETRRDAAIIGGASCKLTNDKGTWYLTAPGTTTVQRSGQDMNIQCDKSGVASGTATVKSSTKGMAFGNILFGGIIGAGVDMASGAAYDYPSPITVEMRDLVDSARVIRRGPFQSGESQQPQSTEPNKYEEAEMAGIVLASSGCPTSAPPVKFKELNGMTYYEAFCSDGRLVHSVCTDGSCRLRTSRD